ncbi:MAG TPA: recombinase RecA, partial [Candidatus Aciduliprofundum boonei]|nr:recombinase RecA [Candidatus Aciduliprofundum boonei]
IFSLTLMKNMKNSVYITTEKVFKDIERSYPWIDNKDRKRIFVLDGKYKYENSESFKSIFYLFPESFRYALNLVEKGRVNTIIIDSWHTILEEMKYKEIEERERREIYDPERFFLNLIKLSDMGVNIIIAKEGIEEDELSYVADGVVTLNKMLENGRMERGLTIDKLRGVKIKRSEYVFSLKDGKAHTLVSSSFKHPRTLKEFPKKEIKIGRGIPSCVFDEVITFKRGDTVFYDFEEYVPGEYHLSIIMSTLANFLKNGIKSLVIPPNDMDTNELKYQIYLFSLEKELNYLNVLYNEQEMEDFITYVDMRKDTLENLVKIYLESSTATPLVILGYDRLYSYLTSNELMQFVDFLRNEIRKRSGILIISGKISEKGIKRFCAGLSDIYLKVNNVNGNVIMYGIKPWTHVYHLDLSTEKGYPKILMEEIL